MIKQRLITRTSPLNGMKNFEAKTKGAALSDLPSRNGTLQSLRLQGSTVEPAVCRKYVRSACNTYII